MPRPGPRPFECVKRSWHSDRHQPIRGSIIQQIFRCVHENHSPGTKKNREWQEKLPLVVLKSEEIMYSKANSEAEYIDPETLWDRLNDAIDTIIRKDESLETDQFLPPCVEAALNLGCVPVRSSRSQRNTTTRSYLTPKHQDSGTNTRNLNAPNVQRPVAVDRTHTFPETSKDIRPNLTVIPPGYLPRQMVPRDNGASSIYPLYHGFHFQPRAPQMGFRSTHQNSNNIIIGRPVFQPAHESLPPSSSSSQKGCSERLCLFDGNGNSSKKEPEPKIAECDLSLRLGPVSSSGKGLTCVNDVDSGRRSADISHRSKEFAFFPLSSEAEVGHDSVTDVRKRKTVGESETEQFLQLERMKRRGL